MTPWKEQALAHWDQINRMALRRYPQAELAEEAALFVMERLAEDDWRRLRSFTGRSTFTTYLGAVTLRLLEDFSRQRFGRVKPPLWIRRLGGIWLRLFRLLCQERYSPADAIAILCTLQPSNAATVETATYQLLGEIPSCGEYHGEQTELNEETLLPNTDQECSAQEHQYEEEERRQLFLSLGRVLFSNQPTEQTPRLLERLAAVGASLPTKERLLLKLCYRDGVAVTEAGRMLGWNRFQVHGRLRRLLQRLRQDLVTAGLDKELRLLL